MSDLKELEDNKIFVIEDEPDISRLIQINLELEGAEVHCFNKGESVIEALGQKSIPDLMLLDLMLPGLGGLDLCRWLREHVEFKRTPIIMVTAKGSEEDIVHGLELGADDYVTKPFSIKVLMAKVKASLKRQSRLSNVGEGHIIKRNGIEVCVDRHEVLVYGQRVNLRKVEFKILHFLITQPGRVFTRNQLVDGIHGENHVVTDRSIDVQIVSLRKKLGKVSQHIKTVHGVGYCFGE